MGAASYLKKVKITADGGTNWYDIPATNANLNHGADVIDDTEMATNAGARKRLLGLLDFSVSGEISWSAGNTAIDTIRAALLARTNDATNFLVQYLPIGAVGSGFQGPVVVENFNFGDPVEGKVTVNFSLQGNGPLVAAS